MKDVAIYTTPSCHFCHMAKEYFTGHNIEFTEHDVSTDSEKRQEMLQKSQQMGVPVITVADKESESENLIVGFDEAKLTSLLGI